MASSRKRPEAAAMERLLARYHDTPEELILRLAWQAGLSRGELNALDWAQVDLETPALLLPGRTVPLDPDLADCLRRRRARRDGADRVLISDRTRRPMTPENVSRLAKLALSGEDLTLMDLRHDYLLRQIESHGWAYAARVSGMAVTTLRTEFSAYLKHDRAPAPALDGDETEYALWRIVQQEGSSVAGLAIWMCWQLGLQPGEAAALTWDQVDLPRARLRLPDRTVPMGNRLHRLLTDVWARQADLGQSHVFLAPTTGRPIDLARVSVVSRTALIRGGLEDLSLRDLCAWASARRIRDELTRAAEERGSLTREDVTSLLGVSENTAWTCLSRLAEQGDLVKVGARYYPVGSVVAPEDQAEAVRSYIKAHGPATRQPLADLLRVTPYQATYILRRLVEQGVLARSGKRYVLPPDPET